MNQLINGKFLVIIPVAYACFSLSPTIQALSPAPDGGYANRNTAEGTGSLFSLSSGGSDNVADGYFALSGNTTGSRNTATGSQALIVNTTGSDNTANGFSALFNNTGTRNTAVGSEALRSNSSGARNTATGVQALFKNTSGLDNTANGLSALWSNTDGNDNTAIGFDALFHNTGGDVNTAVGDEALLANTTGGSNTAVGGGALGRNVSGNSNTAVGISALLNTTGSNNIGLGATGGENLTTGSNNIDIGALGTPGESNTIRIGGVQSKAFIRGIRGTATGNANAIPVVIDSAGQLGTTSSSQRFKHHIESMDQVSEAILALRPVTFHYKTDSADTPQFGLIAEEVAKVNPDLVVRDDDGKPYTIRYDAVNAMLLNEFLKEHRKVEELQVAGKKQETTISRLKFTIAKQEVTSAEQQKEIKALAAGLHKVSAQLELQKASPRTVANNR